MNLDIKEKFFRDGFVVLESEVPREAEYLLELAQAFGKCLRTEKHASAGGLIQEVSNHGLFGDRNVAWHNDFSYGSGAFDGTLLYNQHNGESEPTIFVNMVEACRRLDPAKRAELRAVEGEYRPPKYLEESCFTPTQLKMIERASKRRPLVFDHPVSREECLYFSPESLVRTYPENYDYAPLVEFCETLAFTHHWKRHQILLFDNLRFMHRRAPLRGERVLRRIQFRYT